MITQAEIDKERRGWLDHFVLEDDRQITEDQLNAIAAGYLARKAEGLPLDQGWLDWLFEGRQVSVLSSDVELIASGYEWNCPNCGSFAHEIAVTEFVACPQCKRAYRVADYEHAIG